MIADPEAFAQRWLAAWNDHDVEAVLAHFHDDATFSSPFAATIVPESGGRLIGKSAIRAYWTTAIVHVPDLHFRLDGLFVGVDDLVIAYRNQMDVPVCEILSFEGDLVVAGHGTYPPGLANPVGALPSQN